VSLSCYSSAVVPGAVDVELTELWSFDPSDNRCSQVSLVPSSTVVAQRDNVSYPTKRAVRAPSLSEHSVEIRLRLMRASWQGGSDLHVPSGDFLLGLDFARQVPSTQSLCLRPSVSPHLSKPGP